MTAVRHSWLPSPEKPLTMLRVERGHMSYALWRNISIAVWVGQATVPVLKALHEVSKEMVARFPRGHSSVAFVLDGVPPPTPDAQALVKQVFEASSGLLTTAMVLEGSGFWASGLRGMLNNSHRDAASPTSLKIATDIDSVVGWFCEEHEARTGVEIAPMRLRQVLLHARQACEKIARGQE